MYAKVIKIAICHYTSTISEINIYVFLYIVIKADELEALKSAFGNNIETIGIFFSFIYFGVFIMLRN